MTTLLSPDDKAVQVDVPHRGGNARYFGTTIDVTNPRHERELRAAGYVPANVGGRPRARGRRCLDCGFGSWFTTCSRCGGVCEREA